jgi:hypothetical protein
MSFVGARAGSAERKRFVVEQEVKRGVRVERASVCDACRVFLD